MMAPKQQEIVFARKTPRQARSRVTVEAIFEATARIIEREGSSHLTTNAIARRAGISVGSLYDYFPSKDAILVSMAQRQLEEDQRNVTKAITEAMDNPGTSVPRIAVHTLVKLHSTRQKVRRVIMAVHFNHGLGAEHAKPLQIVTELLAAKRAHIRLRATKPISQTSLFVLSRAVIGVMRAAFEERSPLLASKELEDELVHLIQAYLKLPPE